MNNTGKKKEFDTLESYLGPGHIAKAPDGFTERIMMQVSMENAIVRTPRRTRYEVFVVAGVILTTLILVIIAGLMSSSESTFFNSLSQFLGSINVWLPEIKSESLKGFSIPSVLLYVSAGILILAMLDMALNRVFHNKD